MGDDRGMEKIEVELLTDGGNNAVVRMPGRAFPGVVIQGDTLSTLWVSATEALEQLRSPDRRTDGLSELENVVSHLDAVLTRYERALDAHQVRRPYNLPNR